MLFKRKPTSQPNASMSMSGGVINLGKAEAALNRQIIDLSKHSGINLAKHQARVFVVIDRSGSMTRDFRSGSVQRALTRLLPIARRFDDNGELEVFVFDNACIQAEPMNIGNYENYVQKELMNKGLGPNGGTYYAPVIRKTTSFYNDGNPVPAFGIVITDGDNFDQHETDIEVRISSRQKIFYQFVGIGNSRFDYLEKLDDLDGRNVDNTAFIRVSDFDSLTDDELYKKLLEQYPQWLRAMHIS